MKNSIINLSKICSICLVFMLIVLSACKNKDNIEPQGFLSADVDGKDWFKKMSKQGKKHLNLKPFGYIEKRLFLDTLCNNQEISINFGVQNQSIFYTQVLNISIPKSILREGDYKVYNVTEDCSKKQVSSLFIISVEDPPFTYYSLNEKKENSLKILKIDRQNKFIEGRFELNYKLVYPNYEEYLDFKNGYFKIYYTIDL